jgi:uncharacterized protein
VIINSHSHMGYSFIVNPRSLIYAPLGEDFVQLMDEHGIDKTCASCTHYQGVHGHPYDPDYREANREIAQEARKFPDRLIPFLRVNPNYTDRIVDQIKQAHDEWGFMGFGEMNPITERYMVNDLRLMEPIMRYAADYHWPIHFHAGYWPTCQPALFAPLVEAYPEVNIILGHIGYVHVEDVIALAQRYPSVHVEPAANGTSPAIRALIDNVPIKQIIYGDDMPFCIPTDVMDKFRQQPILSEADKDLILGGNLARLLGFEG